MLSVIVPLLNEADQIADRLQRLQPLRARGAELIVVDGGSTDASAALATPLADRVITSKKGRARQMNAGVSAATGDVLLFLHADTVLPAAADQLISSVIERGAHWGRFDVEILGQHPRLPMVAWFMNHRSRLTGIATGDQAMFATRPAFVAAGYFPDQALMEDIALSRKLRAQSRPACIAEAVQTSGRRWDTRGFWRTVLLMWWLRLAYFFGVSPRTLARYYGYEVDDAETTRPRVPEKKKTIRHPGRAPVAVLVFAKAPVAGEVKTRLIPALGAEGAAQLAVRFLERTLATAKASGLGPLQLWCTPEAKHPALIAAASKYGASLHVQVGEDLGERMHYALASALLNSPRALLIGTDCPVRTSTDLRRAAEVLKTPRDAVFCPAEDGGYVLVGLTRPCPGIFSGITWGDDQVMARTRQRARVNGLRLHETATLWDVDRPEDLHRLESLEWEATVSGT